MLNKLYKKKLFLSVTGTRIKSLIIALTNEKRCYLLKTNSNYLELVIANDKLSYFKKKYPQYNFKVIKRNIAWQIIYLLKTNWWLVIGTIITFFLALIFNRLVINIRVEHNDTKFRELLTLELAEYGVKPFTLKKNYQTLTRIKKKIIVKYRNQIEWLEISYQGMTYVVKVEKRIVNPLKNPNNYCNIIATKTGNITKIINYEGELLKKVSNFVEKNDLLISGAIKKDEEVKKTICAKGTVYGEVWYKAHISLPLIQEIKTSTDQQRNNILIHFGDYHGLIFRPKYRHYKLKKKLFFSLGPLKIYQIREQKILVSQKKLSIFQAEKRARKLLLKNAQLTLRDGETIIAQNVLKKTINNSRIELELFIAKEEIISRSETIEGSEQIDH